MTLTRDSENKELVFGVLTLILLLSFPFGVWLDAFVLQRVWETWVSGLWETIPMITFAQAIGISFVFSYITQNLARVKPDNKDSNKSTAREIFIYTVV